MTSKQKPLFAAAMSGILTVLSMVTVYTFWELSQGAEFTAVHIPAILMNAAPYGFITGAGISYYVYKYVSLAEGYLPRKPEEVLRRV